MERREYFRIEQKLGIHYRPLSGSMITDPYDERLQLPVTLSVVNQIRELDHESGLIIKKIQARQGDTARYLRNLNQRMTLLESAIFGLDKSYPNLVWQPSTYSETGIDFKVQESLAPNTDLHLILAIPAPDGNQKSVCHWLSLIATIVSCDLIEKTPEEDDSPTDIVADTDTSTPDYHVGLHFKHVSESDKQYLARHILSVQSTRRRHELEARESTD